MLDQIDIINGIMTTIFVVISIITGVRIGLKYRKEKLIAFLLFGVTWAGMVIIYYPIVLSFWGIIFFGQGLSITEYLFICSHAPIIVVFGVWAWSELVFKKHQKEAIGLTCITSVIAVFVFMYNTFNNPILLGYIEGVVSLRYGIFVLFYLAITTILGILTGYLFYRQSRDATEPEVRLKGLLIWIAFISFFGGGFLDGFLPLSIITIIISRVALIFGSTMYFFGFTPPKIFLDYMTKKMTKTK
jgi:hypothetical protein